MNGSSAGTLKMSSGIWVAGALENTERPKEDISHGCAPKVIHANARHSPLLLCKFEIVIF